MINKEAALKKIEELVQRFEEQILSYKKAEYNETQTRRDFIDPFFKALGWDMDNSQGNAEAYREVIHEDRVKVGAATKAPDYSFKLAGGKRLFFVEAKKPSVMVKDEVLPAYQIRRYAWSAKMPVSILTDFEEFAIYDCNKKPNPTDKPSVGRIKYITYKDYAKEFDFIWDTFSKERVLKGSFDKFIAADKNKKGTATVDKEFLTSLDEWRKELALNIALRNEALTEDELNFVVQQTIDRIIFLRIAEDRGVEEYGRLKSSLKGDNYYQNLFSYFKEADSKYNSGLFDFKKDNISLHVLIDNKTIKSVISELYYPISPYEFSVLSVEILGSAYEQFLGKQIKLSPGHRATIEEKPEVRKAGGVYYTPQYIVEYIVENTVGKLAADKKPADIAKLKIVDPACGSGSFLLGAYQYLLNWHMQYYKPAFETQTAIAQNNKDYNEKQRTDAIKERNKLPLTPDGNLTTALKKQILLNNIYGVDIDTQAVEVTKLSLLLRCMEGETGSSITAEMRFGERILPTLDSNIKSGNSLIDLDFYDGQMDFEPALEKKVKPFSWQQGFKEVFKQGGFDVAMGNPPYIQSREEQFSEYEKKYYQNFKTLEYQINTFGLFIEKGINILKNKGLLGFIIPNYWLSTKYDHKLRNFIFKENHALELINVYKVFEAAVVDTLMLTIQKEKLQLNHHTKIKSIDRNFKSISERLNAIKNCEWIYNEKIEIDDKVEDIEISFQKSFFLTGDKTVSDYFILKFGAKLYEIGKGFPAQKKEFSKAGIYEATTKRDKSYLKLLKARHVKRYLNDWKTDWVKYGENLAAPRTIDIFKGNRILVQRIVARKNLDATFTNEEFICNTDVITLKPKDTELDCRFVLAILNSSICSRYIRARNINLDRAAFPKINTNTLETFPLPDLQKVNKILHDEVVKLVETMLQLQQQKQTITLPEQVQQLEQRIAYTDDKINEKVYALYRLSAEEIGVVEGG